jgi:hypothetical protein
MNILLIFSLIILTLSYISIVPNGLSLNYLFKLKDETNPQEIIDNQISKTSTISISLISAILICAIIILFSENNIRPRRKLKIILNICIVLFCLMNIISNTIYKLNNQLINKKDINNYISKNTIYFGLPFVSSIFNIIISTILILLSC